MAETVGQLIARKYKESGYDSLGQLASVSDVTVATLSRIMNEVQKPSPRTLSKLAPYLGTSYEELMCAAGYLEAPSPATTAIDPKEVERERATETSIRRITEAIEAGDDQELIDFWREMKERPDLWLLFKQARPMSDESIRRAIKIAKALEEEIDREEGGF